MATVIVNGRTFKTGGNSVSVVNGRVVIDGEELVDLNAIPDKEINITIKGDVENMEVGDCKTLKVTGSVNHLKTVSGDVEVRRGVTGDVKTTSGDVNISGNVGGNVTTTSGDVKCRRALGNVNTVSGDISR